MPMAAAIDRATPAALVVPSPAATVPMPMLMPTPVTVMPDAFSKDALLAWYRGEFAASNAIIDALCGHLKQLNGGGGVYAAVFEAIHRRRLNWIPVLQMQKYHSIADVTMELCRVAAERLAAEDQNGAVKEECCCRHKVDEVEKKCDEAVNLCLNGEKEKEKNAEKTMENDENGYPDYEETVEEDDSLNSEITDAGSHEVQANSVNDEICANHEDCEARPTQMKLTKGFSAKEHLKGHTVNVVKGMKLYEDVFTDSELSKLIDFVNEYRAAGQNGELSGDTFILFNQQMKGNRRELIQFGVPIFGQIKDEAENQTSNIEPIPLLLENVIDHLIQWKLIPEYKRPNGCIINFFEEDEHSQPFLKPPHLDQPISTLLLSESTMAFGRTLVSDNDGNYKGPLMLTLKKGSLLVLRGNSSDMARHVMCASPEKRVSLSFFKVRPEPNQCHSPTCPPSGGAMTVWQPTAYGMPNGVGFESSMDVMPKWGVLRGPVVMLAPVRPMVSTPRKNPCNGSGTGVFLPWQMSSRKPQKHLPPRAQRGRLLALASAESHVDGSSTSEQGNSVDGKSV